MKKPITTIILALLLIFLPLLLWLLYYHMSSTIDEGYHTGLSMILFMTGLIGVVTIVFGIFAINDSSNN